MLSNFVRTGAAAAFLASTVLVVSAQQQPPAQTLPAKVQPPAQTQPPAQAQPPVKVQPTQPAQPADKATGTTYRAKQVLGSKIMIQGNTAIGTVDDIVFDDAGNLEYLIVANTDGKMVTVPWEAAKFDVKSQTAVVNIAPEVYKTIPTYTTTTYPEFFTPVYRTTTYKYYNVTPRELRRIDRIIRR